MPCEPFSILLLIRFHYISPPLFLSIIFRCHFHYAAAADAIADAISPRAIICHFRDVS
jgi:hypothetical protein